MELSTYQKDIIEYFINNKTSNIKINALAGCGKSFILQQLIENSSSYDIYVAFNTSIAEEFKNKITRNNVKVSTIHSLAYSIMNYNVNEILKDKKSIGETRNDTVSKVNLDNLKIYKIIDDIIYVHFPKKINFLESMFYRDNFVQLYNICRLMNVKIDNEESIEYIIREYNLFQDYSEMGFERLSKKDTLNWIKNIDEQSLKLFNEELVIDFTDMLYITNLKLKENVWKIPYWALFTNVYIDECQDLSNLQLTFLRYIKRKNGRYIFTGDFYQSCYYFAASNANSFNLISKAFAPIKEFDLPINYRCPISHLVKVNKEFGIPIKPRKDAPEGCIISIEKKQICNFVKPGDMIISRKNKWLPEIIVDLAIHGIPIFMQDKESVSAIKKVVGSTKALSLQNLKEKLEKMVEKYFKNLNKIIIEDSKNGTEAMIETQATNSKIDNIQFVIKILENYIKNNESYKSINDFSSYLDNLLNTNSTKDAVRICSVHKAKGLEADNVFVLNNAKICKDPRNSFEQNQQEINLSYISLTRSKNNLYLVKEEVEQ